MTRRTFRSASRSSSGFASSTIMSADFPTSIEPVSSPSPMMLALPSVAACNASWRLAPTMRSKYTSSRHISYCVTYGHAESVPSPTGIPCSKACFAADTIPSKTTRPFTTWTSVEWVISGGNLMNGSAGETVQVSELLRPTPFSRNSASSSSSKTPPCSMVSTPASRPTRTPSVLSICAAVYMPSL